MTEFKDYLIPLALILFFAWRFFKTSKVKAMLPDLIKNGAIIVDVRSPAEFKQGSNATSINIPLDVISARLHELDKNKPVVLCCASGARSGMAATMLKQAGFAQVVNAGAWTNTMLG